MARDLYQEERPYSAREINSKLEGLEGRLGDQIEAARFEGKTDNNTIIAQVKATNGTVKLHTKIMWGFGAAILTLAASNPQSLASIIKLVGKL